MRFRATLFYSAGYGNELIADTGALITHSGRRFNLAELRRDRHAVIETNSPEVVCRALGVPCPDPQVMEVHRCKCN